MNDLNQSILQNHIQIIKNDVCHVCHVCTVLEMEWTKRILKYELTFKAWFCAELISWTARLGLRNYFSTFLVSFPFHYWDGNQNGLNEAISHSSWKARKQLQSQNLLLGQVLFGREIGIINLQTPRNMELTKKIPILKKEVIFSKVAKILDIT